MDLSLIHIYRDRSLFPAAEIVAAATRGGARALGGQAQFGQICAGMRADLVVVSTQAPHMFPVYNPYSALVYGANSADVDLVMTGGEVRCLLYTSICWPPAFSTENTM